MTYIGRVFERFTQLYLDVSLQGCPISDPGGQVLGHAEAFRLIGQKISVSGWVDAEEITLIQGEVRERVEPSIYRADVIAALGLAPTRSLGFDVSIPLRTGKVWLSVRRGHETISTLLCDLTPARLAAHRSALWPKFLGQLTITLPLVLRWALTRAPHVRTAIKRKMGLEVSAKSETVCQSLFSSTPFHSSIDTEISIVLPIYNAFELLPETLQRLKDHTDLPYHLIIVEDCSTDNAVRPYLKHWISSLSKSAACKVTLIENPKNIGFIGSVNKAFKQALSLGNHVVLLNSDAMLPKGWANRLLRPILADHSVATVTPMSNDAEIFNIPAICQKYDLLPREGDLIDEVAKSLHHQGTLANTPTGVGFCMAMNKSFLQRLPEFDPAFGRGYGEEVDWCQRARSLGGKHIVTPSLFVEHRGGASFGQKAKNKLISKNNARIKARYPQYDQEIQDFIQFDPIAPGRLALAIALSALRQYRSMPIYLGHLMGGGAEDDLQRRVQLDLKQDYAAIVVRVGGSWPWRVDLHGPWGVSQAQIKDFRDLQKLLAPVEKRKVIYSCGVGAAHPLKLPDQLNTLSNGGTSVALVHDFFMVSPSYTLLNGNGVFTGLPDPDESEPAHCFGRISLTEWQSAWRPFLKQCDEIEVFSKNSARLLERAYPECAEQIVLRPHNLIVPVPSVTRPTGRSTIGVLGNIGLQKGAKIISKLSVDLARDRSAGLVVIGNVDPAYPLHPSAKIHGSYDRKDIPSLIRAYGITDWLIPSIWPETFSFTTHEALATGIPVWTFDLGAQADAVKQSPNKGGVIPLSEPDRIIDVILGGQRHRGQTVVA